MKCIINSTLDLHGNAVVVTTAELGGVKLAPGTYSAGDTAVEGFIADSAGGGTLTVGGGFFVIIR